jgi:hypothetical protein
VQLITEKEHKHGWGLSICHSEFYVEDIVPLYKSMVACRNLQQRPSPDYYFCIVHLDAENTQSARYEEADMSDEVGKSDSIALSEDLPEVDIDREKKDKGVATEKDIQDRHGEQHDSHGQKWRRRYSSSPSSDSEDSFGQVHTHTIYVSELYVRILCYFPKSLECHVQY